MYRIARTEKFEAAHMLPDHKDPFTGEPGKCSRLHGHSYKVTVVISGAPLPSDGILLDFSLLKRIIKNKTDKWDHQYLNELEDFYGVPTTAENIAKVLYMHILYFIPVGLTIDYVEVSETENTWARYSNDT